MTRVKINLSGTHFEFDREILENRERSRLVEMCDEADKNAAPMEFFVNRPSDCFVAVLSFYQTGELHMPATVCPKAFKKELIYWGVSETELDKCCRYRYFSFFDTLDTHEKFRQATYNQAISDGMHIPPDKGRKIKCLRRKLWRVIDFKERTVIAKIYLTLVFTMVLVSIMTLGFSTVPAFQRKLSKCELLEFLEHSEHQYAEEAKTKLGDPDCSESVYKDNSDLVDDKLSWEQTNEIYVDGKLTTYRTNVTLPSKRVPYFVFDVLELITSAFFTTDLLLRLVTCPSLKIFIQSITNLIDILAVAGFYVHLTVINIEREHRYSISWIRFINYLQIFRVMRLFRIVRNVRASRVLTFSLRQNGRDMTLLVLLVMIEVSTAACLIYFIEDRETIDSIPEAWYWAIITLTTVGYGDITIKTGAGRVVAAILAICAVIFLAITLPMFVNNFLMLYQFSCVEDNIQSRTKNKKKDPSQIMPVPNIPTKDF
ncbi:potassium voltage-gated channel subfamily B member 2-like [Ruditapes philippinarum]|uniref:potassium voltage-gated channel subfamily B member 2-like n=1 Tax=Ruditapes philippinarum TaxID=129788 RepID=UPI00295B9B48|nr:potassium voltage-gated channel subfamily B member 2-like [Ruditapes philippinarum]